MPWLETYLLYFFILLLLIAGLYIIGKSLMAVVSHVFYFNIKNAYEELFASLFIGMSVCVTLFSVIYTRIHSVNILFVFIAVCMWWAMKKEYVPIGLTEKKKFSLLPNLSLSQVLELFLYAIAIYTFLAFAIISDENFSRILNKPNFIDIALYSVNVETMLMTGQENSYNVHNLLETDYWGMTTYHFFDLWIACLIKWIYSNLEAGYLLGIVVYSLCTIVALTGTWAVLNCFNASQWYLRLLSLLCFFTAGWFFASPLFINILGPESPVASSIRGLNRFLFFLPKRFVPFLSFLPFILFYFRNKELMAFISLLIVPLVSVECAPAVFGGVLLFFIANFKFKFIDKPKFFSVLFIYFLYAVLFITLYKIFGNSKISLYNVWSILQHSLFTNTDCLVISILFVGRAWVLILFLYFVACLLAWRLLKSNQSEGFKKVMLLQFLMIIAGSMGWAILFPNIDSIQFLSGILVLCQTLILIFSVTLLVSRQVPFIYKLVIPLYIVASFVYNIYVNYSFRKGEPYAASYLQNINRQKVFSLVGISIQCEKDFIEGGWALRHVVTHTLGDDYLMYMPQYLKPIELGSFDVPETPFKNRLAKIPLLNISVNYYFVDEYRNQSMQQSGMFYRFYNKVKLQIPGISIDEAQVAFIDYYKTDWGIISKRAVIGPLLQERIVREITDSVSGQRFVLLKIFPSSLILNN